MPLLGLCLSLGYGKHYQQTHRRRLTVGSGATYSLNFAWTNPRSSSGYRTALRSAKELNRQLFPITAINREYPTRVNFTYTNKVVFDTRCPRQSFSNRSAPSGIDYDINLFDSLWETHDEF